MLAAQHFFVDCLTFHRHAQSFVTIDIAKIAVATVIMKLAHKTEALTQGLSSCVKVTDDAVVCS